MKALFRAPSPDCNFDSACSSPFISAPSSPQRFNTFFSAPTSPYRPSTFEFEEKHKASDITNIGEEDFAFEFSANLQPHSLSAEELFDRGKIRPLISQNDVAPISPSASAAIEETKRTRGRNRTSSFTRKGTRSVSPLRVSDIVFVEEEEEDNKIPSSSINHQKQSKLSKLKDLLLFRSASEGRATAGKDPLRKYTVLSRKKEEEVKNSSFPVTGKSRWRRPVASAHEVHYTENRAVQEEMRRRTYLPYRQGLLGCLGFTPPPALHEISRGIGSFTRG